MAETLYRHVIPSPLGPLEALATSQGLCALSFLDPVGMAPTESWLKRHFGEVSIVEDPAAHQCTVEWLEGYFSGKSPAMIPLDLRGSELDVLVWRSLLDLPSGRTGTYGQLADQLKRTNGARAIGSAVGRNPVAILVPCHRILGTGGSLTGYGGGLDRKRWLLHHEGALLIP